MARNPRKRPKSSSVALLLLAACIACNREQKVSSAPAKPKTSTTTAAASPESALMQTEVGDIMPAYSTRLLDGKTFDVASEKGSVVLLNVWATWCGPCRVETPELQALHQKYGARGLKVVGVSVDEGGEAGVKQFVGENKITYPIGLDAEGRVASVLRTTVLPTSVLIGRDGRIKWRKIGPVTPAETAPLDAAIEQALGKTSS